MMQTSLIVKDEEGDEMRENLGMAYRYDQLNRLIEARGYTEFNAGNNSWGTTTSTGVYNNFFSYDANGNILTQQRWGRENLVDDLTYYYAQNNGHITQNRLYNVNDAAAETTDITSDMEDQDPFLDGVGVNGNNNYIYSKIGELVSDELEEIASIEWRVDSKIKQVIRTVDSDKMNLKFDYDAMGNRVAKHVLDQENVCIHSTYYVRDASGNVMAVYERDAGCESGAASYALTERHIYGSSRVGMNTEQVELTLTSLTIVEDERVRVLGKKQYEISNHLGNVLTVVSDEKRVLDTNSDGMVDTYMATIISVTDYSPFGVTLDGRSWSNDEYRYGYQGSEIESTNFTDISCFYRFENSKLGCWLSIDPKYASTPWDSPYSAMGNNPIAYNDIAGDKFNKFGQKIVDKLKSKIDSRKKEILSEMENIRSNSIEKSQLEVDAGKDVFGQKEPIKLEIQKFTPNERYKELEEELKQLQNLQSEIEFLEETEQKIKVRETKRTDPTSVAINYANRLNGVVHIKLSGGWTLGSMANEISDVYRFFTGAHSYTGGLLFAKVPGELCTIEGETESYMRQFAVMPEATRKGFRKFGMSVKKITDITIEKVQRLDSSYEDYERKAISRTEELERFEKSKDVKSNALGK